MKKNIYLNSKTTRKAILTISCLATVFTLSFTAFAADSSIDEAAAQEYALTDAGVDSAAVKYISTKSDYEDGQSVYEVEFTTDDAEYEYQLSASDATVLKKSIEFLSLKAASVDSETSITLESAKEIALTDAELTADEVTFTKEKLEQDDRITVYDIEFYTDSTEYDYEVSAGTGDILSFSVEQYTSTNTTHSHRSSSSDSASSDSTVSDAYISVDEARAIALENAGLSESEVTFKKAKLDKEDRIMVYEIEFYQGRTEYEYTLNASTGEIIEFEIDWDD
ncbi:MAG: PepSY domain-containing protein [Lachnospiraceae bacterium]|nr:PepSY domain-containing protein [Lachnospiraceae bacterium]